MSLQFILGSSGSGKSTILYENVIEESIRYPKQNFIVLVPDQFTMQTQRDLVNRHPKRGIMNIDVLSFGRLAHRIFEEVGENQQVVLDDVGKSLILRKVAKAKEDKLSVLGSRIKKPGYISEVKSVISEFTQYDIGSEQLEELIGQTREKGSFYYKLQDLTILYEGFKDYLEGKYITGEELLDVLCKVLPKSQILKDSVIVMDGFTGFTPVQNKLIRELLTICSKVIITVTIDGKEEPYVLTHPYQLFALSKQMVTSLVKIAQEEHVEIKDPVRLVAKPVKRFEKNPALGFLEEELFRYTQGSFLKAQDAIEIHRTVNPKEEAAFAASAIRKLIREKGYRYKDIAVIAGDLSAYADEIEKQFARYEIPVFLDYKRNVLLNAFVEYVRSLLYMEEQNFTYEGVFRFLRTGLTGFEEDEIDLLENYVIALGIKGYKRWQEPWFRRMKGMDEEELSKVNSLRCRFIELIGELTGVLKQRRKTVKDITVSLHAFFAKEELQKKMKEYELQFQASGEAALAKEYAQIYRIVIELFDKFVELLGDEPLSMKEYCDLLDAGLQEAKVGVIPPGLDQVTAGDLERTRLKNVKVLFLMGINDTFIPGNAGAGGLLSQRDRELLQQEKITLAPSVKEQAYIQKFYLYLLMTKPGDLLILSYSKASAEGKALRPAYLIQDMRRLFPSLEIIEEEAQVLNGRELTPKTGFEYIACAIREKQIGKDTSLSQLLTWYLNQPDWKQQIESVLDAGMSRSRFEKMAVQTAKALYGEEIMGSVTRLESYAQCPFQQFAAYGLQLSKRQEYQFAAMDLGNLFHKTMEHFSEKVEKKGVLWTDLTEEEQHAFTKASVEESIVDYENTILYSTSRNEYMIARLTRLLNRTVWALTKQLEQGDFVPSGYEVNFGNGKIDRIDICEEEDKVFVKIIDYKTGMKAFDISELYYGLQLQLASYLKEALSREQKRNPDKEIIPAGIFYYRMQDPIVQKEADTEAVNKAILKELKLDGIVNDSEEVISHLDRDLQGNSLVVPVGKNRDQSLSKASKTVSGEEFQTITTYVEKTMTDLNQKISQGELNASPYKMGDRTGCDFCCYKGVCGFDEKQVSEGYRTLPKLSKEEVMEQMAKETK